MFEAQVISDYIKFLFLAICFLISFWACYGFYQSLLPVYKSSDKFLDCLLCIIGLLIVSMLLLGLIT